MKWIRAVKWRQEGRGGVIYGFMENLANPNTLKVLTTLSESSLICATLLLTNSTDVSSQLSSLSSSKAVNCPLNRFAERGCAGTLSDKPIRPARGD